MVNGIKYTDEFKIEAITNRRAQNLTVRRFMSDKLTLMIALYKF